MGKKLEVILKQKWLPFLILLVIFYLFFPVKTVEFKAQIPREGDVSTITVVSPITFEIPKNSRQFTQEQQIAAERVLPIFVMDEEITQQIWIDFRQFRRKVSQYRAQIQSADSVQNLTNSMPIELRGGFSRSTVETLVKKSYLFEELEVALNSHLRRGVIDRFIYRNNSELQNYEQIFQNRNFQALLVHQNDIWFIGSNKQSRKLFNEFDPLEVALEKSFDAIRAAGKYNLEEMSALFESLSVYLRPNVIFLKEETEKQQEKERGLVSPNKGKVFKGMQLISAGEVVTADNLERLKALHSELYRDQNLTYRILPKIGVLIFCILLSALSWYVLQTIFRSSKQKKHMVWSVIAIIFLQLGLFYLSKFAIDKGISAFLNDSVRRIEPYLLIPILAGPVLGTVLFDIRIGWTLAVILSTYLGAMLHFDLYFFITAMIISFVTCISLNQLRYRGDFLKAWIVSVLTYLPVIAIFHLIKPDFKWIYFAYDLGFGVANLSMSLAFTVLFFIPLFEKFFKLSTNLSLMELSDYNHPALKRISLLTPGTFNHSLMVANLSEKAAEMNPDF
jgi:cyclic-di-AMP phosphodiesterase PgpH